MSPVRHRACVQPFRSNRAAHAAASISARRRDGSIAELTSGHGAVLGEVAQRFDEIAFTEVNADDDTVSAFAERLQADSLERNIEGLATAVLGRPQGGELLECMHVELS